MPAGDPGIGGTWLVLVRFINGQFTGCLSQMLPLSITLLVTITIQVRPGLCMCHGGARRARGTCLVEARRRRGGSRRRQACGEWRRACWGQGNREQRRRETSACWAFDDMSRGDLSTLEHSSYMLHAKCAPRLPATVTVTGANPARTRTIAGRASPIIRCWCQGQPGSGPGP